MAVIQPIVNLVDIFVQHGLTHAVICPGSRSAALTLALARNEAVTTIVSIDERSAGFIALGLALGLGRPVAVVCTSGTAAYNFAPAVAEACFQHIPLLVLTADRPKEWVHQQDGQTIYQAELFGKNVKKAFELPCDTAHPDIRWYANRIANDVFLSANTFPKGPVHLNVPVREPFYPSAGDIWMPDPRNRLIGRLGSYHNLPVESWHMLQDEWEETDRILIAGGQGMFSEETCDPLARITEEWEIPVLGDITANLGNHPDFISMQDAFLHNDVPQPALRPDLLVTFGESFLSKRFKNFIRKNPPRRHWHIGPGTHLVDSFQSLTLRIPVDPGFFFRKMLEDIDYKRFLEQNEATNDSFKQEWLKEEYLAARIVSEQINKNLTSLDDLTCIGSLVSALPEDVFLHLGNSMPVRHANLLRRLGLRQNVWANRGTSGIDGCVSTAIGNALATSKPVCLIVGDVSFLYDRNGFLLEQFPQNLKIVVLNNGGGNIFRLIDGPRNQPELGRFFETRHSFTARATAADAGIAYDEIRQPAELEKTIGKFVASEGPALLEIFTDPEENRKVSEQIRSAFERSGS
ncbi:MAG: 2-succinyl-5-enolpyruvyl-6-hydroxy-3-cyclohexene-1-carboxylic-acid synthase [Cytophagaceae bacterium SCN 52-12]|nr:MAG: 2-succinyl-5-enolpyruvyl-6-hydroxy-3-cyclohexene-1-carboxylic-acid synthase [Cytophagaceae bacterium SCN 52-12]